MNAVRESAKQLEQATGVAMDVDHYIPLQGKYVSGMNHQDNLFIMPASQNRKKNNFFNYDQAAQTFSDEPAHWMRPYADLPDSHHRLTGGKDHADFLANNKDLVRARQDRKYDLGQEMSIALDRQMIDPSTKIGKNARELWGEDANRYVEKMKKELGLLGV